MKRNKTIFIAIFLIVLSVKPLFSQEKKGYLIQRTNEKINLDGVLDELTWQNAEKATGFDQVFPSDTIAAKTETEIMLTYDDEFIYFAAKMYNLSGTREYVTPSLRRDYRGASIDGISFIFDTFGDNTNAFQFG
ncbi:MAG: hydrolase, partial [Cyclobacteriaceae bacterium]|nr:hydrolase [Cyclobacteriaceae bacterium]